MLALGNSTRGSGMKTLLKAALAAAISLLSGVGVAMGQGERAPARQNEVRYAINLHYEGAVLARLLGDIERKSGVEISAPTDLASDIVSRDARANTWADALRELLHGYNYAAIAGDDGRVKRVFVSGRNGNGSAARQHGYVSPNADQREDLLVYQPLASRSALPEKYRGLKPGSVTPISIAADRLARQQLGDRMTLRLPIGQYDVVHDNLFRHSNGDTSWVGYLDLEGKEFRVVVTRGAGGVIGQINTPDGLYRIEQAGGKTWLINLQASGMQSGALENDQQSAPFSPEPGAALPSTAASPDHPATVDLMVLHTPALNDGDPVTRINHLLALTQQSYVDSGIYVNLRLVHTEAVDYTGENLNSTALNDLTGNRLSPDIARLREAFGADLVALVRPLHAAAQGNNCGISWVGGSNNTPLTAEAGFAVVGDGYDGQYYCHDYTFAHELGHLFGSTHDQGISDPGIFPFSYAWAVAGRFATVMSYLLDVAPLVGKFANPGMACTPAGDPCGDPDIADNARTTNLTAPAIAAYKPTMIE